LLPYNNITKLTKFQYKKQKSVCIFAIVSPNQKAQIQFTSNAKKQNVKSIYVNKIEIKKVAVFPPQKIKNTL
jgi:hypothetical protein